MPSARESARWSNALQELAATTPHSIPVTVSTDPRHSFAANAGAAFAAGAMSQWPEPLGLGALRDPERIREFADIARQEYVAVGIRSALHPQIDLVTEPRWGRQFHSFGNDAEFVADVAAAYIDGFQRRPELGPDSVATMAKHFPGGGPQSDGEDPHFPYGREQVYPGGQFEYHLIPFRAGDRGRHLCADALLRDAGRAGAGRRGRRGGRVRPEPADPHRAAATTAGLRRGDLHRLGTGHRHVSCSASRPRPVVGAPSTSAGWTAWSRSSRRVPTSSAASRAPTCCWKRSLRSG